MSPSVVKTKCLSLKTGHFVLGNTCWTFPTWRSGTSSDLSLCTHNHWIWIEKSKYFAQSWRAWIGMHISLLESRLIFISVFSGSAGWNWIPYWPDVSTHRPHDNIRCQLLPELRFWVRSEHPHVRFDEVSFHAAFPIPDSVRHWFSRDDRSHARELPYISLLMDQPPADLSSPVSATPYRCSWTQDVLDEM